MLVILFVNEKINYSKITTIIIYFEFLHFDIAWTPMFCITFRHSSTGLDHLRYILF